LALSNCWLILIFSHFLQLCLTHSALSHLLFSLRLLYCFLYHLILKFLCCLLSIKRGWSLQLLLRQLTLNKCTLSALLKQFISCLLFECFISLDHNFFKLHKVIAYKQLFKQFLILWLKSLCNKFKQLFFFQSNFWHHRIEQTSHKFFKFLLQWMYYLMYISVSKFILLFVVKHYTILIHKVEYSNSPLWGTKKL
jgi:hypothetical protein